MSRPRRGSPASRAQAPGLVLALALVLVLGAALVPPPLAAAVPAGPGEDGGARREVVVEAPRGPLHLGERFELVVRGDLDAGAELELGDLPPGLRAERLQRAAGERGVELRQELRALREGEWSLDGLALRRDGETEPLAPVTVRVVLDLPRGHVPRVAEPLAPPVPDARRAVWPWLLGALGVLGLAGLWAGARRGRPAPAVVRRPPDVVAAEALARLRSRLPRSREEVPAFVVAVSGVLRRYVEERFALRAPESTTEEFLAEVARRHDALAAHRGPLDLFLGQCDLVKFAAWRPEPAAIAPLLDVAESFLEATRAPEPAVAPGQAAEPSSTAPSPPAGAGA